MSQAVIETFYLSGIIIGAFLCFLLLTKPGKQVADYLLAGWLMASSWMLVSVYLLASGQYAQYPTLTILGLGVLPAQGPFLYLYIQYQAEPASFQKMDLLHFLPVVFGYLLFLPFYSWPSVTKVNALDHNMSGIETANKMRLILVYISGLVYIPLSFYRLLLFRQNIRHFFSNIESINFRWLLYLVAGMGLIWIIVLFFRSDRFVFITATLFVWWTGYFGVKQAAVFSNNRIESDPAATTRILPADTPVEANSKLSENPALPSAPKYQKSSLDPLTVHLLHEKLLAVLTKEKPYLDPELTLDELAALVQTTPNYLSQVINTMEQKTFYELVNEWRVKAFLEQAVVPDNKKYTLLTIAYTCGFNSKASFNRNFKKVTGKTPRAYLDTPV
jgi:AraC-like DNA-binding protein